MRRRRARMVGIAAVGLVFAVGSMLTACAGPRANAHGAAASATSSARPTSTPQAGSALPAANPGADVDAASQRKADSWLAGAIVPPGAVSSSTAPDGLTSGTTPNMWCQPMADAVGYWTLPSTSAGSTLAWLTSHASRGMTVTGGSGGAQTGNRTNVGGTVIDQPALMSLEALIFTVTPMGSGSGIRADALTMSTTSVCATPPPGTMLGIGG